MHLQLRGQPAYLYSGTRAHQPGQPAITFVHGAGFDHSVWLLQSRYFAFRGWNVLAPDLPGHGRSAGPALSSIENLAEWLVALWDEAEIEHSVLIGHSMGSLVSLETAARWSGRVDALGLVGSAAPMPVAEALLLAARDDLPAAVQLIMLWAHGVRGRLGGNPVPGQWLAGMTRQLLLHSAPGVLHTDLNACNGYATGIERATQVTCPSLLLVGDEDRMTPGRASAGLAAALVRVKQITIPGAGHALMAEAPDTVLDALIALCRETA
jgi:pimeloyl-ACP methyl ester carboxylesterase